MYAVNMVWSMFLQKIGKVYTIIYHTRGLLFWRSVDLLEPKSTRLRSPITNFSDGLVPWQKWGYHNRDAIAAKSPIGGITRRWINTIMYNEFGFYLEPPLYLFCRSQVIELSSLKSTCRRCSPHRCRHRTSKPLLWPHGQHLP